MNSCSKELEKILNRKNIKDIIIFGSALWSQTEAIIHTLRNYTGANIRIFFRDEDINNLNLGALSNLKGVRYNSYRLDIPSFLNIRHSKPQLAIILCDNPYNIGYRKAKLYSLFCGTDTVIFSNILNEVRYFNFKEIWQQRKRVIKKLSATFLDSIIAPLFYIIFVYGIKIVHKLKNEDITL